MTTRHLAAAIACGYGNFSIKHMDYRQKLNASQARAHLQNIATKIDREMRVLRSQAENSPTARRRWVWELLQNGKDVHNDDGVRFQIEFQPSAKQLVFRHSGKPFTADNIRFLIEQISTKDREKDSLGLRKATGKFGTGFLSTHLLSEVVIVEGIAKEPDLDFKQFRFELDRSGYDLHAIASAVERAKQSIQILDELPTYAQFNPSDLNTAFTYAITDSLAETVAQDGIDDLRRCLPYSLIYEPTIKRVDLPLLGVSYEKESDSPLPGSAVILTHIRIRDTVFSVEDTFSVVSLAKDFTTVSMPVHVVDGAIHLQPLSDATPRLFCDFPLVGTETFPFPAVVNNPHFDPTDARDGVFLTGTQRPNPLVENNRRILADAVLLYIELMKFAVANNWQNLRYLADLSQLRGSHEWVTEQWFRDNILIPIRRELLHARIVTTAQGGALAAIMNEDGATGIWFPSASKQEVRERILKLASRWFPFALPNTDEVEWWYRVIWDKCSRLTSIQVADFVEGSKSTGELAQKLIAGTDCIAWLKEFYSLIQSDEQNRDFILLNKSIFPNQLGVFCRLASLYRESGSIGGDFKDILGLLGYDIRGVLAAQDIDVDIPPERTLDQHFAVQQISSLALEKCNDRETAKEYRVPFGRILAWFRQHPESAEKMFPALYRQKHLLYDDVSIMENIAKAQQLDDLLTETGTANIEELKQLFQKGKSQFLPVTQELLASMGITSVEEWQKALRDKNLAAMFSHKSVPTTEMFIIAQTLIGRAKDAILAHLGRLPNYDVSHAEETAPTVLGGILKDGRDIHIVARPAYSGEVIIYYSAERDVLDFEDSELWVDTGVKQMRITLGHLLKTTSIQKFPI